MNGFQQDAPTRTREVAPAISSSGASAGWNQRSLNVVTTANPASSAATAKGAYEPGRLSVCSPSPSWVIRQPPIREPQASDADGRAGKAGTA